MTMRFVFPLLTSESHGLTCNQNVVVIVVQIVVIIDSHGGRSSPRPETLAQVSYEKPSATGIKTQWGTLPIF